MGNFCIGYGALGRAINEYSSSSGIPWLFYDRTTAPPEDKCALSIRHATGIFGKPLRAAVWAAGVTTYQGCERSPEVAYKRNILSLAMFLETAVQHTAGNKERVPKVFVYLSSYAAVGNGTVTNPKPIGNYGEHKLLGENLVQQAFRGALNRAVILRLPNILYPCDGSAASTHRLFDIVHNTTHAVNIEVDKQGRLPKRCYVDSSDFYNLLESTIEDAVLFSSGGVSVYNMYASRNVVTVPEFIAAYNKASGRDILGRAIKALPNYVPLSPKMPNTFVGYPYLSLVDSLKSQIERENRA